MTWLYGLFVFEFCNSLGVLLVQCGPLMSAFAIQTLQFVLVLFRPGGESLGLWLVACQSTEGCCLSQALMHV